MDLRAFSWFVTFRSLLLAAGPFLDVSCFPSVELSCVAFHIFLYFLFGRLVFLASPFTPASGGFPFRFFERFSVLWAAFLSRPSFFLSWLILVTLFSALISGC